MDSKQQYSTLDEIKRQAIMLGACKSFDPDTITSETQLIDLAFTAQGREFCQKHAFPSLSMMHELAPDSRIHYGTQERPIYSDGQVMCVNCTAEVYISDPSIVHKIILMHGSNIKLKIAEWCVVLITQIGRKNKSEILYQGEYASVDYE